MKIGVVAAQGAFLEHIRILHCLGAEPVEVRLPEHLSGLDGLILPGGESTSIARLMTDFGLAEPIKRRAGEGLPVLGTCAGMVLLANKMPDCYPEPMGLMSVTVKRNIFGRQRDSFETALLIPALGEQPFPCVFIRAPAIVQANGKAEIIARLPDGTGVAARQGKLLATAFHPELTDDLRFHRYFLDVAAGSK